MELSLTEAAAILDCSTRTLRDRVRRGDLRGTKRGGRWMIDRRELPLTDSQRAALDDRRESVRSAVDDALGRAEGNGRHRSLADLETFAQTAELRREILGDGSVAGELAERLAADLEGALLALAEGAHAWDRESKVDAFRRARSALSRAVGLAYSEPDDGSDLAPWANRLEQHALPTLGGLLRWAEGLEGNRRRR